MEEVDIGAPEPAVDLLAVNDALEKFEKIDKAAADLVKRDESGYHEGAHWNRALPLDTFSSTGFDGFSGHTRSPDVRFSLVFEGETMIGKRDLLTRTESFREFWKGFR